MAKKNLDDLVIGLAEKVSKESKYRTVVDTYEHVYIVSKKKLLNQLYSQISGYYIKGTDAVKFPTLKKDILRGSEDEKSRLAYNRLH